MPFSMTFYILDGRSLRYTIYPVCEKSNAKNVVNFPKICQKSYIFVENA